MNSSLKKALGLFHFPLFLFVIVLCEFTFVQGDVVIQARIDSLTLAPLEYDVLRVLYHLGNLASVESFTYTSIALLIFMLASINHKQFIINEILYLFFLYFFTAYFFSRLAPGMMPDASAMIGISLVLACTMILTFFAAPAMLIRKLKARVQSRREAGSIIAASFKECKVCGTTFLSNPQYCSKCLNKLA
jgi:hypothetical protein